MIRSGILRNRYAVLTVVSVVSLAIHSVRSTAQEIPRHSSVTASFVSDQSNERANQAAHASTVYAMNTTALFQTQSSEPETQRADGKVIQTSGQRTMQKAFTAKTTAETRDVSEIQPLLNPVNAPKSANLGDGPDFASQLPDDQTTLIQFIEILQWTIVVLLIAVVAVMGLRKYQRAGGLAGGDSAMTHVATLAVRNHFQAHLLEIGTQRFLVTTDRSGVKTVNPITSWESFESPLEDSQNPAAA